MDIKKAFDTVNHKILIRKLYRYGIRNNTLDWIQSYLHDQKQFVQIKKIQSNFQYIRNGVPQGSTLGGLVFIIFVNDLCNIKIHGQIITYADDTVIIYKNNNLVSIQHEIQEDMLQIKK